MKISKVILVMFVIVTFILSAFIVCISRNVTKESLKLRTTQTQNTTVVSPEENWSAWSEIWVIVYEKDVKKCQYEEN